MTIVRLFLARLWALVRARQMDRDLDDEIAGHLTEATDDYIRRGLSPEDPYGAARRSFGGITQTKDATGRADRSCGSTIWRETSALARGC